MYGEVKSGDTTHTNKGPGNCDMGVCNFVIDHYIDHTNIESRSAIFQAYILDKQVATQYLENHHTTSKTRRVSYKL